MLSTIRMMIGQTRDAIGLPRRDPDIETDIDMPVSSELATLTAIRLADMAGLGPRTAES